MSPWLSVVQSARGFIGYDGFWCSILTYHKGVFFHLKYKMSDLERHVS